jgi:hypothetical protein
MIELVDQPHNCVHCKKKFSNPRTLFNHMCEQKRRALQKDEKRVQSGFYVFNKFFEYTQNNKNVKSYEDFCKSPYYNAFVKFGSFMNNAQVLYPDKFVEYLIKKEVKLDNWCKESIYVQYLYDIIKSESPDSALERSLTNMIAWADENKSVYNHYFLYATTNRITNDMVNGKISPWVILNTANGKKAITTLNDEQLKLIEPAFDLIFWKQKFNEKSADVVYIKQLCKELNL